jgi:cephalosporin hydroxylase
MTEPLENFKQDIVNRVSNYSSNEKLMSAATEFFDQIGVGKSKYVYNFFWLGVPIIQVPQDLQAMQEIIWNVKPDLIIETGIAWGGSVVFSASMLAILEACGQIKNGHVLAVDIEIRPHNKKALVEHPLSSKYTLLEGSSIEPKIVDYVRNFAKDYERVLVCLDSNHTHQHVLEELEAYAPLVSQGSYCVVEDTAIEDAPVDHVAERGWGKGNSPKSAIVEYQRRLQTEGRLGVDGKKLEFQVDELLEKKIVITGSPDGYLRRRRW